MWNNLNNYNIHLEITSHCQAFCPGCARLRDHNSEYPEFKIQKHYRLEDLISHFSPDILTKVNEFLLSGNYGDPLMHPNITDWINYVQKNSPNNKTKFWIHTNGGIGTTKQWQQLGKLLSRPGNMICFAFDGLEDTNHLYRRGVQWENAIQNAKTFIQNGGRAQWKMIKFDHNSHQIEQAQKLAHKLGFNNFKLINAYEGSERYLKDNPLPKLYDYKNMSSDKLKSHLPKDTTDSVEIECDSLKEDSLFIDSHARVYPCCWHAINAATRTHTPQKEEFHRFLYDKHHYESDFNSLYKYDFLKILDHPYFNNDLKKSWISNKECLSSCKTKCTKS